MEEADEFKHLGVWFDRKLRCNEVMSTLGRW